MASIGRKRQQPAANEASRSVNGQHPQFNAKLIHFLEWLNVGIVIFNPTTSNNLPLTMSKSDFRNLIVWQEAHCLAVGIYKVSKKFPADERYGLCSQLRRAAYSVPANIAEGRARKTRKDYLRFLNIARGSLNEVEYFILLARDLQYYSDTQYEVLNKQRRKVGYFLYQLINKT